MLSLLAEAILRCNFFEQFNYTYETFQRQLKPLSDSSLLGTWRRAAVEDVISTQAKRKLLFGQLKELLMVKPPPVATAAITGQP
jgi:hypothetical protein